MPYLLLALLAGGGALGLYLYGKHQGQGFDFENCLYEKKKQGYTNDKAIQICKQEAQIWAKNHSQSTLNVVLEYGIPTAILGGLAYFLYKTSQKKVGVVQPIVPEQIATRMENIKKKQEETKENLKQAKVILEGINEDGFPYPR